MALGGGPPAFGTAVGTLKTVSTGRDFDSLVLVFMGIGIALGLVLPYAAKSGGRMVLATVIFVGGGLFSGFVGELWGAESGVGTLLLVLGAALTTYALVPRQRWRLALSGIGAVLGLAAGVLGTVGLVEGLPQAVTPQLVALLAPTFVMALMWGGAATGELLGFRMDRRSGSTDDGTLPRSGVVLPRGATSKLAWAGKLVPHRPGGTMLGKQVPLAGRTTVQVLPDEVVLDGAGLTVANPIGTSVLMAFPIALLLMAPLAAVVEFDQSWFMMVVATLAAAIMGIRSVRKGDPIQIQLGELERLVLDPKKNRLSLLGRIRCGRKTWGKAWVGVQLDEMHEMARVDLQRAFPSHQVELLPIKPGERRSTLILLGILVGLVMTAIVAGLVQTMTQGG